METLTITLQSGLASLASYLAAHVLLCLVPAFFIAGALAALVPQQSIIRYLGPDAPKWVSYSAAAGAGSLLAVCSCTIQPLFAGIYKKGAGLGPAVTFLFFAPAANVLALSYTGVALGAEFAIARIVLALSFGIGIGMVMAILFHRDELNRQTDNKTFTGGDRIPGRNLMFVATLVALLIAGTLKLDWLTAALFKLSFSWPAAAGIQETLDRWIPVNEAMGAEGLSIQGLVLIFLLLLIAAAAWRGLGQVDQGVNRMTTLALSLIALTLLVAAVPIASETSGMAVTITGRTVAVTLLIASLIPQARRFDAWDMQQWLWETWRFVRQIFPWLVAGVFLVGVIRLFIQPQWIQVVAGSNTVSANLAGVFFGVFMYFPTLVEVPIAKMFLSLGMHPGPLIAYLMADPELSLQSILITSAIVGKLKAWTYVALVALFSTIAGLLYGAWVDGIPILSLMLALAGLIVFLVFVLQLKARRDQRHQQGERK